MCEKLGISFSLKHGRMFIHRTTLKAIGEPGYIRLLVNRKQKRIAVQSCEEIDNDAYKVPAYENWLQFEVYSLKFLQMIYKMAGWDKEKTYRIYGYPVTDYRLVLFCLEDGREINEAEIEKESTVTSEELKARLH